MNLFLRSCLKWQLVIQIPSLCIEKWMLGTIFLQSFSVNYNIGGATKHSV